MLLACQIERVETRSLTLLPFRLSRGKFLTLSPPYSKTLGGVRRKKARESGKIKPQSKVTEFDRHPTEGGNGFSALRKYRNNIPRGQ